MSVSCVCVNLMESRQKARPSQRSPLFEVGNAEHECIFVLIEQGGDAGMCKRVGGRCSCHSNGFLDYCGCGCSCHLASY